MACTLARVSAAPPQCRSSSSLRPHHHQPRRPAAPRLATLATANPGPHPLAATRREALQLALSSGIALALPVRPAGAIVAPPQGYRLHVDKLDGYSFLFPETWITVTTSGNDVFYRNPYSIEENIFVNLSSPSSSKFASVADLGTPQEAAEKQLEQYLGEFMSTRIGVKREASVISAASREAADGNLYYDIEINLKSYATRQQMAVTGQERFQELEFDRRFVTTLGTGKGRLYEIRLQTSSEAYEAQKEDIARIMQSFRCDGGNIKRGCFPLRERRLGAWDQD